MNSYLQIDKFQKELKNKTGLGYFNGGRTELICRCPFPGCEIDEKKKYNYGRLYVDVNSPVFHCFRCQTSGSIFKLFQQLKLNKDEFLIKDHPSLIYKGSRRTSYMPTSNTNIVDVYDKLILPKIEPSEMYKKKEMYLRGRIGVDENIHTIPNLVLNIREFVEKNNIPLTKYDERFLEIYEQQYVGFVSARGTIMVLRKSWGGGDDYRKLQITNSGEFKDFFGLRSGHIKNDKINKIVICEGIFDLLVGIKSTKLQALKQDSVFWAAALGSHYRKLVSSLLHYVKLPMVDVVVLSDKDKRDTDSIYKNLKNSPMVRNLEIYWNRYNHDFGEQDINPVKTVYSEPFSEFRKKSKIKVKNYV